MITIFVKNINGPEVAALAFLVAISDHPCEILEVPEGMLVDDYEPPKIPFPKPAMEPFRGGLFNDRDSPIPDNYRSKHQMRRV